MPPSSQQTDWGSLLRNFLTNPPNIEHKQWEKAIDAVKEPEQRKLLFNELCEKINEEAVNGPSFRKGIHHFVRDFEEKTKFELITKLCRKVKTFENNTHESILRPLIMMTFGNEDNQNELYRYISGGKIDPNYVPRSFGFAQRLAQHSSSSSDLVSGTEHIAEMSLAHAPPNQARQIADPEHLLEIATDSQRQGNHDDALEQLQKITMYLDSAASLIPHDPFIRSRVDAAMGISHFSNGNFSSAATSFQDSLHSFDRIQSRNFPRHHRNIVENFLTIAQASKKSASSASAAFNEDISVHDQAKSSLEVEEMLSASRERSSDLIGNFTVFPETEFYDRSLETMQKTLTLKNNLRIGRIVEKLEFFSTQENDGDQKRVSDHMHAIETLSKHADQLDTVEVSSLIRTCGRLAHNKHDDFLSTYDQKIAKTLTNFTRHPRFDELSSSHVGILIHSSYLIADHLGNKHSDDDKNILDIFPDLAARSQSPTGKNIDQEALALRCSILSHSMGSPENRNDRTLGENITPLLKTLKIITDRPISDESTLQSCASMCLSLSIFGNALSSDNQRCLVECAAKLARDPENLNKEAVNVLAASYMRILDDPNFENHHELLAPALASIADHPNSTETTAQHIASSCTILSRQLHPDDTSTSLAIIQTLSKLQKEQYQGKNSDNQTQGDISQSISSLAERAGDQHVPQVLVLLSSAVDNNNLLISPPDELQAIGHLRSRVSAPEDQASLVKCAAKLAQHRERLWNEKDFCTLTLSYGTFLDDPKFASQHELIAPALEKIADHPNCHGDVEENIAYCCSRLSENIEAYAPSTCASIIETISTLQNKPTFHNSSDDQNNLYLKHAVSNLAQHAKEEQFPRIFDLLDSALGPRDQDSSRFYELRAIEHLIPRVSSPNDQARLVEGIGKLAKHSENLSEGDFYKLTLCYGKLMGDSKFTSQHERIASALPHIADHLRNRGSAALNIAVSCMDLSKNVERNDSSTAASILQTLSILHKNQQIDDNSKNLCNRLASSSLASLADRAGDQHLSGILDLLSSTIAHKDPNPSLAGESFAITHLQPRISSPGQKIRLLQCAAQLVQNRDLTKNKIFNDIAACYMGILEDRNYASHHRFITPALEQLATHPNNQGTAAEDIALCSRRLSENIQQGTSSTSASAFNILSAFQEKRQRGEKLSPRTNQHLAHALSSLSQNAETRHLPKALDILTSTVNNQDTNRRPSLELDALYHLASRMTSSHTSTLLDNIGKITTATTTEPLESNSLSLASSSIQHLLAKNGTVQTHANITDICATLIQHPNCGKSALNDAVTTAVSAVKTRHLEDATLNPLWQQAFLHPSHSDLHKNLIHDIIDMPGTSYATLRNAANQFKQDKNIVDHINQRKREYLNQISRTRRGLMKAEISMQPCKREAIEDKYYARHKTQPSRPAPDTGRRNIR